MITLRGRVQQSRHRSLIYGDRPRRGRVNPRQDPLPPSVRLDEVVDPPPAESTAECLAPADHPELVKQQVGQPRTVIYGFDRHVNTVSPPTDKMAFRQQLRTRSGPADCAIDLLY